MDEYFQSICHSPQSYGHRCIRKSFRNFSPLPILQKVFNPYIVIDMKMFRFNTLFHIMSKFS